jgi:quinol monooxygenase YgiN
MSISLIVSIVGAIAAAAGAGLLLARCLRAPRADLIAWLVAQLGLLVSLAAQAAGHVMGFGELTFRAMEIGAQLVAPLALLMGLAELLGTTPMARFLSRLYLPALGLIGLVILGTDPLTGVAFSKAWPAPETYYQLIPNKLLEYGVGPVVLIMAVILLGLAMVRARDSRRWEAVVLAAASAVGALVVLDIAILSPDLSKYGGISLPMSSVFALLCLVAVVLTWYAARSVERVPLGALREGSAGGRQAAYDGYDDYDDQDGYDQDGYRQAGYDQRGQDQRGQDQRSQDQRSQDRRDPGQRWDGGDGWHHADQTGDFEAYDDGSQGVYRDGGLYRDEPPRGRVQAEDEDEDQYGWRTRDGAYQANGADDYDSRELDAFAPDGYDTGSLNAAVAGTGVASTGVAGTGVANAAMGEAARRPDGPPGRPAAPGAPMPSREELFGQIAIYTLTQDRTDDFDRLAERVVAQVRSGEPDTLVFIVHAVPSAPMQRILYEVYRDRAAYDRHLRQPYIKQFDADRKAYVLATNVIELGLQQAKISPFPSIADLFGEPGYDTSGFERPDYTREYGSSSGRAGAPS